MPEIDDWEIEMIWEAAADAAINTVHIASVVNPYPETDPRAEIWSAAFRQAYARENGY